MPEDPDLALRHAAITRAHELSEAFDGLVPLSALRAIHHLAYDRNLLGIDPTGLVHIARSLREERDGPMLREGLQGFLR
jgi:hypothetical protein